MSITYVGSNVSEILRFTVFFSVSLKLITHSFLCRFVVVVEKDIQFSRKLK